MDTSSDEDSQPIRRGSAKVKRKVLFDSDSSLSSAQSSPVPSLPPRSPSPKAEDWNPFSGTPIPKGLSRYEASDVYDAPKAPSVQSPKAVAAAERSDYWERLYLEADIAKHKALKQQQLQTLQQARSEGMWPMDLKDTEESAASWAAAMRAEAKEAQATGPGPPTTKQPELGGKSRFYQPEYVSPAEARRRLKAIEVAYID